ncbi:MAG: hypothetical protein KDK75_11605, partial [Alphaproteobacteria bacterium]|nr:hypothetical protein [Alphaproteobacteria bacterium]
AEGATVAAPQYGAVSAPGKSSERSETAPAPVTPRPASPPPRPEREAPRAEREPNRPERETPRPLPELSREMIGLVQKLNAAARDLVEAVDGNLPRDLERRYSAGEHDVYTRRVFEGRGQRIERSLAERYPDDRLVRGRVDSYVRLFERLLDTMSTSPKGENLVESCLASESGRIYVMLAALAGRIPAQR